MTKTRSGKTVRFKDSDVVSAEGTTMDQGGAEAPTEAHVQRSTISEHIKVPYTRSRKRKKELEVEIAQVVEPTESELRETVPSAGATTNTFGSGGASGEAVVSAKVSELAETHLREQGPGVTIETATDSTARATTDSCEGVSVMADSSTDGANASTTAGATTSGATTSVTTGATTPRATTSVTAGATTAGATTSVTTGATTAGATTSVTTGATTARATTSVTAGATTAGGTTSVTAGATIVGATTSVTSGATIAGATTSVTVGATTSVTVGATTSVTTEATTSVTTGATTSGSVGATTSVTAGATTSGIAGVTAGPSTLGTIGANTVGSTSGEATGIRGAPTEAEADEFEFLEYASDDGVVVNTDILLGEDWKEHVGCALLENTKDRGLLDCHQFKVSMNKWDIDLECDEFKERLKANPLYKLMKCSYKQANRVIVSAFVERWHPETNTFHLPFGEMTITLDDVRYITGLPVAGKPLNFEFQQEANPVTYVYKMLGIGIDKVEKALGSGGLRLSKSWLKKNIEGRCVLRSKKGEESSTDQTKPVITVDQAVRGYLLYMICCALVSNRSGDKISIAYLHFLEDLDRVDEWAWGAATLANLYRQLSKGSRIDTIGICGHLTLLEAWVYEHFPTMRPPLNKNFNAHEMVRSLKWKPVPLALSSLKHLREDIDLLEARDVVWDAYREVRTVPDNDVCWFYGCIRTLEIVEAYHPNRVVRQFGHVQSIPQSPIPPKESKRSRNVKEYNVIHESRDDDFLHYANHLVNKDQRMEKARFDCECTDDYMNWYKCVAVRRLTGVRKKKQRDSRKEESSKSFLFDVVDDAIKNISKKSKKNLLKVLEITREFLTTGVCVEHEESEVEAEAEIEEDVQRPKKRGKTTKKR